MLRYERKYRTEDISLNEVLQVLRFHRASFRPAFPDRYINSIYLDTYDLDYYNDNVAGMSERVKQRIRWYGKDLFNVTKPQLEIKVKNNKLGYKKYALIPAFKPGPGFSYEKYQRQHLWLATNNVVPTVMVRYLRSYYQSFDKRIRITIDQQQAYYPVDKRLNFNIEPYKDPALIIELKYPPLASEDLDIITQDFPFRMTRNSKYVQAVMACYGG